MNFELGKQYIVEVTDKGIIPIDEFDTERFFDKDNDDLEFLTDEEKTVVINDVFDKMSKEIRDGIPHYVNKDGIFANIDDVQCVIEKYRGVSE